MNSRSEIRHFYKRFLRLYPPLEIPTVTFVVGQLSCCGTTCPNGMLIGAELFGKTERTPMETLDYRVRSAIRPISEISATVIHELVHIQHRPHGITDLSLLARAVREGMADRVTELVTRREPGTACYDYGRLHEKPVWEAFREVMAGTDVSDWFGNGAHVLDRPTNLGHFVGRQICEAFLNRYGHSRETIARMIGVDDYEEIYQESGYGR